MSNFFQAMRVKLLHLICCNLSAPQDASSIINIQISSKRVYFYKHF